MGGCRKKEKSLGLKDKTKKISLGVQGQTYTHKLGACCHEPTGSQELCQRKPLGGGDFNAVGGEGGYTPSIGDHLQPWLENWGEKNQCLHSWA